MKGVKFSATKPVGTGMPAAAKEAKAARGAKPPKAPQPPKAPAVAKGTKATPAVSKGGKVKASKMKFYGVP
jgi:hypothetical protein